MWDQSFVLSILYLPLNSVTYYSWPQLDNTSSINIFLVITKLDKLVLYKSESFQTYVIHAGQSFLQKWIHPMIFDT